MTNSRRGRTNFVVKQADQTVNNSQTAIADTELTLVLPAGRTVKFKATLFLSSGTTPDIKYAFPKGNNEGRRFLGESSAQVATTGAAMESEEGVTTALAGTVQCLIINGYVITDASSPGSLTLYWAQNLADVSDTKIHKGSTLETYP